MGASSNKELRQDRHRMSKQIIRCQVWEWYGSEDFREGRYKAKGGQEFIYESTPESEALSEDELIDKFNAKYNRDGLWFRYEAKSIDYYWEPVLIKFENREFMK
jgi:hypothetical protein